MENKDQVIEEKCGDSVKTAVAAGIAKKLKK